jgi:hypothetical protein
MPCGLTEALPKRIDFTSCIRNNLPELNEESFLHRVVLPRIFAQVIALSCVLNAAAISLLLAVREITIFCGFELFSKEMNLSCSEAFFHALCAYSIFFACFFPGFILEQAFAQISRSPSEELEDVPSPLPTSPVVSPLNPSIASLLRSPSPPHLNGVVEKPVAEPETSPIGSALDQGESPSIPADVSFRSPSPPHLNGVVEKPLTEPETFPIGSALDQGESPSIPVDVSFRSPSSPHLNGEVEKPLTEPETSPILTSDRSLFESPSPTVQNGCPGKQVDDVSLRLSPISPVSSVSFSPMTPDSKPFSPAQSFISPPNGLASPKFTPQVPPQDPYEQLTANAEEIAAMATLMKALSEGSINGQFLRSTGDKFSQVHTLKTIEIWLLGPSRVHLKKVQSSFIRTLHWNGFLNGDGKPGDGIAGKLTLLKDQGKLAPYLPGFAKKVNVPLQDLQKFVNVKDWKGFFARLLK